MAIKDMYYTVSEAAKELKVSRQTIYRWIADNSISAEKVGGVVLVEKGAIREYGRRKTFESFSQAMDGYLIETVRKELKYHKDDKIERTEKSSGDFSVFLATKRDGTIEEVRVGGIEMTISTYRGDKSPRFSMKLKDVTKKEYEQSQKNKKGREKIKK